MHLERSENFARDVEPDGRTNFNLRKRHILVANGYAVTSADPAAGREDRTHGWLELVLDENGPRTVCRYDPRVAPERAGPIDYGHVLRFFAGQPDPADASPARRHRRLGDRPGHQVPAARRPVDDGFRGIGVEADDRPRHAPRDGADGGTLTLSIGEGVRAKAAKAPRAPRKPRRDEKRWGIVWRMAKRFATFLISPGLPLGALGALAALARSVCGTITAGEAIHLDIGLVSYTRISARCAPRWGTATYRR